MKIIRLFQEHPVLATWISTVWNFSYGVFLLVPGIKGSYWYLTLGVFFLTLDTGRILAVSGKWREPLLMRILAVMMVLLGITICGITYLTINEDINPIRNKNLVIVQAAFSFGLIISAVYNAVISFRKKDKRIFMIRNLSLASAISSILSLERTMLGTFGQKGNDYNMKMEAGTGWLAFVVFLIMAYNLMRSSGE